MEINHEALYRLVYENQWKPLLRLLYRHREAVAADPLLAHAAETFETTFFEALAEADEHALMEELETLFLLHTGGFYTLALPRFEQVVVALVDLHRDHPEAAAGYARHCPAHPRCAAVLAQSAPQFIEHTQEGIDLTQNAPLDGVDATVGLFKSEQEVEFFLAVREVFATYFVYPNVALACLVDYEQIREHLTPEERAYFFRALVDCVVFDQHDGYRPRYCFEIDSPLHDDPDRQARDRRKDRILALAGQTLYRIRKRDIEAGRVEFVALLREQVAKSS